MRRALIKTGSALAVIAAPLAAMAVFAGGASADANVPVAHPVANTIPLEPVATNPHAKYPDPTLNGAAAGAAIGSATGSFVDPLPTLLGAAIGAGIGAVDPQVVPQVLP
ncbi:hypothetical protein KO481_07650 [Nocardia sp. NEAU-G5]|uniref:Glycine zipper domain-containing protein n=1 Tax=Nocardia albiluteola TaxID=2842303 RepID=A0ABS6AV39_9NOCA|nr:glycine zipper domain-containing protein [Nocardia albiluteola]MBU3061396.1 hypothetical protein [Nocardia albiluteola]